MECDDVLVPVGQEARITARLGFELRRRIVAFRVDGEEIGEVKAGWRGCAAVTFTPRREKEYRVVATHLGADRRRAAIAEAFIFSRSSQKQTIILDIDRTLSESSAYGATFKRNKWISPFDDAVDVTRRLARKYDLIVITGRKAHLRHKTERWLAQKGFPRAPLFFSSFVRNPFNHERFKRELIGELKDAWENITIGIGDKDSDARAYLANGLRAIILREKGHCPQGAIAVRNWRSIGEMLLD